MTSLMALENGVNVLTAGQVRDVLELVEMEYDIEDIMKLIETFETFDRDSFVEIFDILEENDNTFDYDVIDAIKEFVNLYGMKFIFQFRESFEGWFQNEAKFAEEFLWNQQYQGFDIPKYVLSYVDYDGLYFGELIHDFTFVKGFVFRDI